MKKEVTKKTKKPYKVVFYGNKNNYEEFPDLHQAKEFSNELAGCKIVPNFKLKVKKLSKYQDMEK